jgi:hypothetical protein
MEFSGWIYFEYYNKINNTRNGKIQFEKIMSFWEDHEPKVWAMCLQKRKDRKEDGGKVSKDGNQKELYG